jgi:hypothetical protein
MKSRKFIYALHRSAEGELSRHSKISANILSRLTRELDKYPLPYAINFKYPYQMTIHCNCKISVHAAGWNNRMDIIRLRDDGTPYAAKYEKSFMTPGGVVNYILRKWGE